MFHEGVLDFHFIQHVNEKGQLIDETNVEQPEKYVKMLEWMLKTRMIDEKLLRMQRQGRIGTYAPFSGQEAAQIGSAFALKKDDWLVPSYRDLAATLVHGMPMEQVLHYVKGHLYGGRTPEGVNILPIQIIIAAQTLHATGVAFASKIKQEDKVTICYLGDGATSEGDFHEALNFAAVFELPVIFLVQNNQYAISIPIEKQMASKTIAQKAIAYGMNGVRVDGNDVVAVNHVVKEAAARARNGEGPTLIEAVTFRFGPHTTSDDPTKYREDEQIEQWRKRDPITRMRTWLNEQNLWDEEIEATFMSKAEKEVDDEIEKNEHVDVPTLDESFKYVYDTMDSELEEQYEEVKGLLAQKAGGSDD